MAGAKQSKSVGRVVVSSVTPLLDCGFDTEAPAYDWPQAKIQEYSRGKGKPIGPLVFIERPLGGSATKDAVRFTQVIDATKLLGAPYNQDREWAQVYMAANPAQKARYDEVLDAYRKREGLDPVENARQRAVFDATIATAPVSESLNLQAAAMREGGTYAERWWARFGAGKGQTTFSSSEWCARGVSWACGLTPPTPTYVTGRPTTAAGASGSNSFDPDAIMRAQKARDDAVHQQNCARADKGALISCNR